MKKGMLRQVLAGTMAALFALGFIPSPVSADETKAEAYLAYAETGWGTQYWNDGKDYSPVVNTNAEVTGPGQYTVGLDFTGTEKGYAEGVEFTGLMIKNGETVFPGNTLTIDSVNVNGDEITLGKTYTSSDDDIETRVNLYNVWVAEIEGARNAGGDIEGVTATPIDSAVLAQVKTMEVTFTMAAGEATAEGTNAVAEEEFDVPSEFKAFMMFSSPNGNWEIYDAIDGKNTTTVLGDGSYSITMKGSDIGAKGDSDSAQVFLIDIIDMGKAMEQLGTKYQSHLEGVAQEDAEVQVEAEIFVDGVKVNTKSSKILFGDMEENGKFRIELYNVWGSHNGLILQDPPVLGDAICPADEITVNFKLKGTGLNTEAAAAEEAAAEEAAVEEVATEETATEEVTEAPQVEQVSTDAEATNGINPMVIVAIVVGVVVVAGIVVVVKKKKH